MIVIDKRKEELVSNWECRQLSDVVLCAYFNMEDHGLDHESASKIYCSWGDSRDGMNAHEADLRFQIGRLVSRSKTCTLMRGWKNFKRPFNTVDPYRSFRGQPLGKEWMVRRTNKRRIKRTPRATRRSFEHEQRGILWISSPVTPASRFFGFLVATVDSSVLTDIITKLIE